MAVMDAGISCWDAKYTYWLLRPSQADSTIALPIGLPNFPAYTSGHSSFSGAASEVLAYLFPDMTTSLRSMADEAGMSRLYGGIHYRFDNEVGLAVGRGIAQLAIQRANRDGSPQ
jgi:membrane-associated phospholipid phosphatase